MHEIAHCVGIAKGTVYLYFQTKESLFLALQTEAYLDWFSELKALWRQADGVASVGDVVDTFAQTLARRPVLVRLIAILHTVLEHNVDLATAVAFKRQLQAEVTEAGALLETRLPFLAVGAGADVLQHVQVLVIGLQHLAAPAPVVRQALVFPELQGFRVDFDAQFRILLTALLYGLQHQASRS